MSTCPDCGRHRPSDEEWDDSCYNAVPAYEFGWCLVEHDTHYSTCLNECRGLTIALLRKKLAASEAKLERLEPKAQAYDNIAIGLRRTEDEIRRVVYSVCTMGEKLAASERELAEAVRLLHLLDNQDARHPDVAAFLDKVGG